MYFRETGVKGQVSLSLQEDPRGESEQLSMRPEQAEGNAGLEEERLVPGPPACGLWSLHKVN